jgi:murein DD-endopeptidase MepM/ murein hydrolase activator NlpD
MLTGSGAAVRIAGDREGGIQALEIEVSEGHLVQACRSGGELEVRNIQHPLRVDVAVIALELPRNGNLLEAVVEAGQTPELARLIAETLAAEIDFTADVRPGDKIQALVEKRYLGRNFHRYGKLLAVRYIGNGGRLAFYRYKPKGADEAFFDGDGQPMRRELLRTPFAWHPIDPDERAAMAPTIEFIDGRMGAVYRRSLGAPVVAMADGIVRRVGPEGDDGLVVEVELEDGRRVRYANLMRTIGEPAAGDTIRQGEIVALVGQTGKTPVPRLRLEVLAPNGERIDPMTLGDRGAGRPARVGKPIPADQLAQFEDDTQSWRRAMRKAAG